MSKNDDTISRRDALKPFCVAPDGTRIPEVDCDNFPVEFSVKFIKKYLRSLPSVQPEIKTDGDTISRQVAIMLPVMPKEHREYQTHNLDDAYEQGWFDLQKCIEKLPPAQPEQHLTCKNCIHLGHGYKMPCKNCKRNPMMPDWYEEVCNNG